MFTLSLIIVNVSIDNEYEYENDCKPYSYSKSFSQLSMLAMACTEFEFIENIRVEAALPQQFRKQRMTLKNVQDCLLLSYILEGFLDEEEFCSLYDVNSTDYPVFEHGKYRRFDLSLRS